MQYLVIVGLRSSSPHITSLFVVTTAVFSTCGMGIAVFSLAALLSLPKQFITVYLGVALEQSADGEFDRLFQGPFLTTAPGERSSTQDKVLKCSIISITFVITVWAMWYIYAQMGKVKAQVIYERRKARLRQFQHSENPQLTPCARQMKITGLGSNVLSHSTIVLTPLSTRPFNPGGTSGGQGRDERGNAVGWSDDSSLDTIKHAIHPTAHEGQNSLSHGGDFTIREHHEGSRSTGPRTHGREVLVNPFDPHQHLRTRSLSGFHRDAAVDNLDTFQTPVTYH